MAKRWSVAAMVTRAGAALLWRPQAVAAGISRGLSICSNVLIPSVFPFLVLCGIVVRVGLAAALGRRLERPTRRISGYPAVARLLSLSALWVAIPQAVQRWVIWCAAVRSVATRGNAYCGFA